MDTHDQFDMREEASQPADRDLDRVLRPASFDDFTGQKSALNKLKAQKCDGVQKNIIKKNVIGSMVKSFVAIVHPITGGNAPDAPPITIFWGVFLFNQIV